MGIGVASGCGSILGLAGGGGGLTLTVFGGGAAQDAIASANPTTTCLPLKRNQTPKHKSH